jgi:hypothetical protein
MAVVILATGSAFELWPTARYLKSYDPDYLPPEPYRSRGVVGLATFTDDVREAMRFRDLRAAMECWKQQSAVLPYRPDGEPNRPLRFYTITFDMVPDA